MGKGLGVVCLLLGIACLLGAVGFVFYNQWEAEQARGHTHSLLTEFQQAVDRQEPTQETADQETIPEEIPSVQVAGEDCIGILAIPALELELPVLNDWSYAKLKKAPCLYYGSCYDTDFVIAAHNYQAHFGRLSQLQPGDLVTFTDVKGQVFTYQVALLETLPKEATREMITSGFALSLYTCTPGGGSRVTVRCAEKETNR